MIETDRLVLRRPREADLTSLCAAVNALGIINNTGRIPWPYRRDDAIGYLRRAAENRRGELNLLIIRKDRPDEVAGGIGYGADATMPSAEIGYWLAEAGWGRGYGLEAARAITEQAFAVAGFERLTASYRHGNEASRRILDRLGFRLVGHGHGWNAGLKRHVPVARLELGRREWQRLAWTGVR